MTTISLPPRPPAPFKSVRSSRDLSLVAFAGVLLAAFALHAGAFLPRLSPDAPAAAPRLEPAPTPAPEQPAFVAARQAQAPASRRPEAKAARAGAAPCQAPRG